MGIYKPPVSIDSSSDSKRKLEQQPKRGMFFMLFLVYLPLTVLALVLRALMIYYHRPIINLTIVDDFVRQIITALENMLYFN